jgi:ribonuclease E
MPNKMLIDASHPEETRVVVLRGNRVEEFDFESADKKQLRGNIYLAKVTRVEPSLQAAFVDYGGNRHGFLAFPEIHPDYYQIPVVDRQALIEDEARAQRDDDEDEQKAQRRSRRFRHGDRNNRRADRRRNDDQARGDAVVGEVLDLSLEAGVTESLQLGNAEDGYAEARSRELDANPEDFVTAAADPLGDDEVPTETFAPSATTASGDQAEQALERSDRDADYGLDPEADAYGEEAVVVRGRSYAAEPDPAGDAGTVVTEEMHGLSSDRSVPGDAGERWPEENRSDAAREDEADEIEQLGGDAMEEVPVHRHRHRKQYKIQEVIKRRQILLVQVVKEERGNKGAALTTYLSLAGRYSVLMPNTARGGGISRKITDATDRQRLKSIVQELEVPEGMGVILRTAGAARTKAEVKRDFEYLLRMWETVRETTLRSTAPTLVYEEGSLIKRAIRDLYNKDIDEVVVAGEEGYREAKEFMRLLMPSHAKNIQPYRDPQPLFAKQGVEAQLDAMFSNQVTLRSGGYIVINQTEALVAIDVNSGRSTREHNIEDTALRTNLEAVDEIARQLRLRDLAGLIVLDLIDMEEARNNRTVERRLKDALKNDRARIQVGTISHFGLLEMSRQRIRSGVLEASTVVCPHCAGSGSLRSTASIALHVLRVIEDALIKNASYDITVKAGSIVAFYILNQKRAHLRDLETRFGVTIGIEADESLTGATYYALERGELASGTVEPIVIPPMPVARAADAAPDAADERFAQEIEIESEIESEAEADGSDEPGGAEDGRDGESESEGRARRRRRRRRGRGGDREVSGIAANAPQPPDDALAVMGRFGGVEPQAATESLSNVQPEAPLPVVETEASVSEPPIPETTVDRRRSRRRPRAVPVAADEPVSETRSEIESASAVQPESAGLGTEAEGGAELPLPTRARRGRRPSKPRVAQEQLGTADEVLPAAERCDVSAVAASAGADMSEVASAVGETNESVTLGEGEEFSRNVPAGGDREPAAADSTEAIEAREPLAPSEVRPKRSGWWQRAKAS